MSHRRAYSVMGACLLSSATVALAQTSDPQTHEQQMRQDQTAAATIGQAEADDTPITLVGCLQRESEYREQHDAGRGGFIGLGWGLGDEYVLTNASRAGAGAAEPIDCSRASGGETFELSGDPENDLEPFVGRTVEIRGMLKRADLDDDEDVVGTTGTTAPRPSGGFDLLGQDLRLREVDVESFREVTAPAQAAAPPSQAEPAAEPAARAPEQQEEPIGTTGVAEEPAEPAEPRYAQPMAELPRTASLTPLAGLLGLLSLAGAATLRRIRKARS